MSSKEKVLSQTENLEHTCDFCGTPTGENAIEIRAEYYGEFCSWHCVFAYALKTLQAQDHAQVEALDKLKKQVGDLELTVAHLRAGAMA